MTAIRVTTYNIHRCVGSDDRYIPERTIDVIRRIEPDIAALQEVDEGSGRSMGDRQAQLIAGELGMEHRFLPTLEVEGGHYGIALLSKYSMKIVKEKILTTADLREKREARGAIWSSIHTGSITLQVITFHLGLSRRERARQSEILLGPDWLLHPSCTGPVVLMGDLNAGPRSSVYRRITRTLADARSSVGGRKPARTWPSSFPLFRLDHIFISREINVIDVDIPRKGDYRKASDHLPVIANLETGKHERTNPEKG